MPAFTVCLAFSPFESAKTTSFAIATGSGTAKSPLTHSAFRYGSPVSEWSATVNAITDPFGFGPLESGN